MNDLLKRIIERIITMKNGTDQCTPQPEAARAELALFNEIFKEWPEIDLNDGVREALKGQQ